MKKNSTSLMILASILVVGLFLAFVLTTAAQSGRRGNKSTQVTPLPTPVADESPKPSPKPPKPRVELTVAVDDLDGFSRVPLSGQSAALQGCVDRLNESDSLRVVAVNRNTTRGEAVKKAKSGTDSYVVWIRIELDRMSATAGSNADIRDVFIEYVLFAPETAKVIGTGRSYPGQRNRSVIPNPRSGGLYGDYLYVQAGRETAEKILASLNLPTRPVIVR
jgi:hypothetical protein